MKFTLCTVASLATAALAAPALQARNACVSQTEAETLVAEYSAVIGQVDSDIGDPVTTAKKIIAKNYQEFSGGANSQLGIPLGAATTPSKQVFIQESQAKPPLLADTIGVFVACDYITWQWEAPVTDTRQFPITGLHLFKVNARGKLTTAWFEFDAIAGAIDDGFTVLDQQGNEVVLTVA